MINFTLPKECILGCCLPLKKQDVFEAMDNYDRNDFFKTQFPQYSTYSKKFMWEDIYQKFSYRINNEIQKVEQLGVKVVRNFSLRDVKLITGYSVFTLFGHYNDTNAQIELFDGLYAKDIFIRSLPDFDGIFDLTLCNSCAVMNDLKKQRNNQVASFTKPIGLLALILIYSQVIANLNRHQINYIDCYKKKLLSI